MVKAAICEDETEVGKYIEKTLAEKFTEKGIVVEFDVYSEGGRFLKMIEQHYHYDMVFMDIEMPQIDGIEVTRRLREVNRETLVVFISNKDDLVFSTFEVQPFRFIRKSHYDVSLPTLIHALTEELQKRSPQIIRLTETGSKDLYSFDVSKICYVEAQGAYCCLNTTDSSKVIKSKLSVIESQLKPFDFIKPHRSYLVNCRYISIIHRSEIELMDHTLIPIGRGHVDEVKNQYIQYTKRSIL